MHFTRVLPTYLSENLEYWHLNLEFNNLNADLHQSSWLYYNADNFLIEKILSHMFSCPVYDKAIPIYNCIFIKGYLSLNLPAGSQ